MVYEKLSVMSPGGFPVEYRYDAGQMDAIQARVVSHRFRAEPEVLRHNATGEFNTKIRVGIRRAARALLDGNPGAGRNLLLMMVGPSGWGKTDCNLSIMFRVHVEAVRAGVFDSGREGDGSQDLFEEYRLFSPTRNYFASLITAFQQRRDKPLGYAGVYDDPSLLMTDEVKGQMTMAMSQLMESFESRRARIQSGGVSSVRATRFMDPSLVHYMGLPYHLDPGGRYALVALWGMSDAGRHPIGYIVVPPPERVIRRRVEDGAGGGLLEVAEYDGPAWLHAQEEVKGHSRMAVTEGEVRVNPNSDLLARILGDTPVETLDMVIRNKNGRAEFLRAQCGGDVSSIVPLEGKWRGLLDRSGWRDARGNVNSRRHVKEADVVEWIGLLMGEGDGPRAGDVAPVDAV